MTLRWKLGVGIGAFILAMAIPITFTILANRIDATDNAARCAIVALVDEVAKRSSKSTAATLASPASTEQQKANAVASLKGWRSFQEDVRDLMDHPTGSACPTIPPKL